MKPLEVQHESVSDSVDLGGDDRQHGGINAVKLIKTAPGSTLSQTRQDLPNSLTNREKQ